MKADKPELPLAEDEVDECWGYVIRSHIWARMMRRPR